MKQLKIFLFPLLITPLLFNCSHNGESTDVIDYMVNQEEFDNAVNFQNEQYMQRYDFYIEEYKLSSSHSFLYSPTKTMIYNYDEEENLPYIIFQKIENNEAYMFVSQGDKPQPIWEPISMDQFISIAKSEPIINRFPDFPKYSDLTYDDNSHHYVATINEATYNLSFNNNKIEMIRFTKEVNGKKQNYICNYTYQQVEPFDF